MGLRGSIRRGLMYYLLAVVQAYLFSPGTARADRRCPLPQPIAVGDKKLDAQPVTVNQLPQDVRNAISSALPVGYADLSKVVKSNLSKDENTVDYLVFYNSYTGIFARPRLLIVRLSPAGVQVFPVIRANAPADPLDSGLADIRPDDLNVYKYKLAEGVIYAKTIGYESNSCWETVISWQSGRFVAENISFYTADGFNYPVGPMDTQNPLSPVDILTASFPDGWKIDRGFQCKDGYIDNSCVNPGTHLGEDWNGKGGRDSDRGYPIFAASRGEVIFAGDGGPGWNGIVVLRHRPFDGKNIFSFYGHLNVDPDQKRPDGPEGSVIRTVSDVLRPSAPGHLVEVEKGQLIGYIGPTPDGSDWPHLHFEIITDPAIAYNKENWDGYRPLYGKEDQWRNPSKFIEENRSYWTGSGLDGLGIGNPLMISEECYEHNGGQQVLGKPVGIVFFGSSSSLGISWVAQAFQNGEIYRHTSGQSNGKEFAVLNPFLAKFRMLFPARTPSVFPELWGYGSAYLPGFPLGLPVADAMPATKTPSGTQFKFQNFEGGALEFHQTGAYTGEVFEIHGAIFNRWSSPELNYAAGPLGLPISDEKEATRSPVSGLTGRFSVFEGGVIHWVREKDKTCVIGLNQNVGGQPNAGKLIADRYHAEDGSGGALGFPVSDDYLWQNGVRCDFENGCIVWTPSEGIQVVVFKK